MQLHDLYVDHLEQVKRDLDLALERSAAAGAPYRGVVIHAGSEVLYHRDDQPIFFRSDPHFARVAPQRGDDHLLHYSPERGLKLLQVVPRDYWYEAPTEVEHPAATLLPTEIFEDEEAAISQLADEVGLAFIGSDEEVADELDADVEPEALMASLDWTRGKKTAYEVHCLREAARRAAPGHVAVRDGAAGGLSERELHYDFLRATGELEAELPYPTIIGWNENAAVLHYQSKDANSPGARRSLLIDAGVSHLGYACDITRTWVGPDAPEEFTALHHGMDALQRRLVAAVGPGVSYIDLHVDAHREVAELLVEVGVLRVSAEEAIEGGITRAFFPHGLGHHLGLQVHDVGGHMADATGVSLDPPDEHPFLRTTRPLEEGHVVTIEPGLYFIEMLLTPLRSGADAGRIDWNLVERLSPCGGIRIEDDVLVTREGGEDLTRPLVSG
jgi:Xaa-Pro dipeptidase